MDRMDTEETLTKLQLAAEECDLARRFRDATICEAAASGLSYRAIAQAVGLSHQRVAVIVRTL